MDIFSKGKSNVCLPFKLIGFVCYVILLESLWHVYGPSKPFPGVAWGMLIDLLVPFENFIDRFFAGNLGKIYGYINQIREWIGVIAILFLLL